VTSTTAPAPPLTVIVPGGRRTLDPRFLYRYRDLLGFLVARDLQVRFSQTALGVAWIVLQPVLTVAAFSLFFGRLGKLPSEDRPYPLYVLAAQLAWQLFARIFGAASESFVHESRLVTKVFFPRALIVFAQAGSGLVEFAIAFVLGLAVLAAFGYGPGAGLLLGPLFVAIVVTTALGAGLLMASLNVRYRDVRHVLPFLTQLWFLVTPIAYGGGLVPEAWRPLHALNPLVGAIDGFRWMLLGTAAPSPATIAISATSSAAIFLLGALVFQRLEASFADEI